jgi:apolipoprotein N-acyltransferase
MTNGELRVQNEGVRPRHSRLYILYSALPFVVSAALLTVIQAPIDVSFLAWVAFVPFIVACSPEANPRRLFLISYLVCLFYWLVNLYWVAPVTIVGWLIFCTYTALLWPVLMLCLRYCRRKGIPLFLASAVLIVGIERMQGFFLGGFFWRFLAHSQYHNTTIIQIADIFGAGGVSFLIAMVNGLIAELIIAARERKLFAVSQFVKTGIVLIAVVGAVLYGRWRIGQADKYVTAGPMVASLQSNVPQSVKRSFESGQELFDGLMVKSEAAVKAGAELAVWPETMVQAMLNPEVLKVIDPNSEWSLLDQRLKQHAKGSAYLLVGAYGGTLGLNKDMELGYDKRFNSAFLYRPDGEKAEGVYNKIHLVPFGEVLPLRRSLSWFYNLLMKIKFIPYNFDYSLDYGTDYTVFQMADKEGDAHQPQYAFAVIICYEDTVPSIARKFALDENGHKRIDWLVNISNDGWFVQFRGDKVQPSMELAQHAAVCAFRAVENRLAVVRSVNTGISCMIDSLGRIRDGFTKGTLPERAMARTGMAGWFMDRVPIDSRVTFFSKHGEWLDFCCQGVVILLIIVLLWGSFARPGKRRVFLTRWFHGK